MTADYILIGLIAFICETIDSSLGMGYGTILTPVLLFLGYQPLEIVPLILLSEFITGILSAIMHHKKGNVNLKIGSQESKVALILAACSFIGTVAAASIAISVSKMFVKGYIAFLLITIGITTYMSIHKTYSFSWIKIFFLGILASFNKGISGGGYGPLVTGGQVLSGLNSKNAVGITSLSEGLTCLVGIISYFFLDTGSFNLYLAIALIGGAVLSIPISVNVVKKADEKLFKKVIAISIIILGLVTFFKTFNHLFSIANLPLIITLTLITIPFAYKWVKKRSMAN